MRVKSIFLALVLIFGLTAFGTRAESARWVIKPVYKSVIRLSDNLYAVKQTSGKVSVMDSDGSTVIAMVDSVTPFCEGHSLVMTRNKNGFKLDRILNEDKSSVSLVEEVYVSDYPFFSEGLLGVTNRNGKAGYIDGNGHTVIPFKYSNPRPFSNGLAAVSKGKNALSKMMSAVGMSDLIGKDKVYYINTIGGELRLPKEIGDIYFGSTFKDGEALVINKDRQYCIINPNGQLVRIEPVITLRFDSRFALADEEESSKSEEMTYRTSGPELFSEGGLTGYRQGSNIVLPPQFSYATPFIANRAIATRLGATGVLGLVGGSVSVTAKKGEKESASPDEVSVDLLVTMPDEYKGALLEIESIGKNGVVDGVMTDMVNSDGDYDVDLMVSKNDYEIRIISGNLDLWNSRYQLKSPLLGTRSVGNDVKFSFSTTKVKANKSDTGMLTITVSNDSNKPLNGAVKMVGASPSEKKVNIPPGGKKQIRAIFSKILKKGTRTVTITIDGHSASRRIELSPFVSF